MAATIVENAKVQRPSVCNAAETLLVHRNVAANLLTDLAPRLEGVELVGDEATREILGDRVTAIATDEDYATEFLDLKLLSGHRHAGRRHRPSPLRLRAQRGDRHQRLRGGRPLHPEVDAAGPGERIDPLVDGEPGPSRSASDPEAPRPWPHGPPELTLKFVIHGEARSALNRIDRAVVGT
jgi:hypothetical protein